MLRFLTLGFCLLMPPTAFAQCEGQDLIQTLSDADRATLTERAAETAYPEGLLWRATRGDTTFTLFGTYHFEHDRTAAHLAALKPMIDQADRVYLEVSNDDQDQLQRELARDPSIMFIMQGPTLPDLLGEEDWQRLTEEMNARAIPGFMAAKFKPFWAAMMLGIGPCEARNSLASDAGIDKRIGDYASEIGNPSRSLEDFRKLLTLFDSYPQEEQLDMIRLMFSWSGDADDLAYTLRQRYLAQEVALIWEFSRLISLKYGGPDAETDFDLFEQQLLIERNHGWVEVLMRDTTNQTVFIAVGAAHLPGEHGLLHLLDAEGFDITRLPFDG
ncbi:MULTISPECIES: TraB/GumN family protein [unclassified Roseovarius]|uniref:TraB/GumN family protein n=1 Tax=unclassified Roseovarius TaxID=2614913 RepID=UPI00273F13F9|nr:MULTISPECIES: TraB/GumN family protein [unclassified Roseovarius]